MIYGIIGVSIVLIGVLIIYKYSKVTAFFREVKLARLRGRVDPNKVRELSELYRVLLSKIDSENSSIGICTYIQRLGYYNMLCTTEEMLVLFSHFESIERPVGPGTTPDSAYYWPKEDYKSRRAFIRKIINELDIAESKKRYDVRTNC